MTTLERPLGKARIEALAHAVQGRVAGPRDRGYGKLRKPWLKLVEQRPAVIVEAASAADVAAAIRFARAHDRELGVTATGHGIAAACDGGVLLHLGRLERVEVDAARRVARVGPGVTSGALIAEAEQHGLAFPVGQVSNVGVTGFALGGGIGWLMRKLGPASSSVLGADVVLADGSLVHASAEEYPDLLWALRGGGGNLGVVVGLELRLAPLRDVYGGIMVFPIGRAAEVFRGYRDWAGGLSDDTSSVCRLFAPPVGRMPQALKGLRACMIAFCHADPDAGSEVARPLAALGKPLYGNVKRRPLSSMAGLDMASHVSRSSGWLQAEYLRFLSDDVIDRLLRAADPLLPPVMQVEVQQVGGALGRSSQDGAFEPFDAPFLLHLVTEANPLDPVATVEAASRGLLDALSDDLTGHAYYNYLRWDEAGRVPSAFTPAKLERLRGIKRRYDPDNLFRLNLNVAPAA